MVTGALELLTVSSRQSFSGVACRCGCTTRADTADDAGSVCVLDGGDFVFWPFSGLETANRIRQAKRPMKPADLRRPALLSTWVIGAVCIFELLLSGVLFW